MGQNKHSKRGFCECQKNAENHCFLVKKQLQVSVLNLCHNSLKYFKLFLIIEFYLSAASLILESIFSNFAIPLAIQGSRLNLCLVLRVATLESNSALLSFALLFISLISLLNLYFKNFIK